MDMYAIATRSLIDELKTAEAEVTQVWFADDSSGAGTLDWLKRWWDHLREVGPSYGYFPKAARTNGIVKNPELLFRT